MLAVPSWMLSSLAMGVLAIKVSRVFLIPLMLVFVATGAFLTSRKCPCCGKPILYNSIRPGATPMWTASPPRHCTNCGEPLT